MSRDEHGVTIPKDVFLAAAYQTSVRVVCRCSHTACFDPHGLWWRCEQKNWDMWFSELRKRLYCSRCWAASGHKVRPAIVEACRDLPTIELAFPPAHVWRRELRRFRG